MMQNRPAEIRTAWITTRAVALMQAIKHRRAMFFTGDSEDAMAPRRGRPGVSRLGLSIAHIYP